MKVTCGTCANEFKNKCSAKKGNPTVALKKRRNCDKYSLDETKVKEKVELPRTRVSYADVIEYKKRLKEMRKEEKMRKEAGDKIEDSSLVLVGNDHPLTGDLSQFTSTASKLKGN